MPRLGRRARLWVWCYAMLLPVLAIYAYVRIVPIGRSVQLSLEMAITDQLTGLHNRRYMTSHLDNLMAQAAKAALRRVEEEILRDHVAHCIEHAITSGDKADQRRKIAELMDVVSRADR